MCTRNRQRNNKTQTRQKRLDVRLALLTVFTFGIVALVLVLGCISIIQTPESTSNISPDPIYNDYIAASKSIFVWGPSIESTIDNVSSYEVLLSSSSTGLAHRRHLAQFCSVHGISNVKVYIGCAQWDGETFSRGEIPFIDGVASLISTMSELSPSTTVSLITYVNDEPNNMTGWERITELVESILLYNDSVGDGQRIASIIIDQTPTDLEQYEKMITMARKVKEKVDRAVNDGTDHGFYVESMFQTLWLTQVWKDTTTDSTALPFAQHLLRAIGAGTLMANSNTLYKIQEYSESFNILAQKENARISVGLETRTKSLDITETIAEYIKYPSEWFVTAPNFFNSIKSSAPLSEYTAIQDYAQYHTLLYTTEPYNTPESKMQYLSSK